MVGLSPRARALSGALHHQHRKAANLITVSAG